MTFRSSVARSSVALLLALAAHASYADPHDVFGVFVTQEGDSHIEISDCGDGSPCGTVVWIDPESLEDGVRPEDLKTKSTGEAVLGLTMLSDFERAKKDWRGGKIYSPKVDKTYSSRLKRLDDNTLEVKGCIGFFCQTQIWMPKP